MVLLGASILTVLVAVAQLGSGAKLANVSSDSKEQGLAGVASVDNTKKTETVTKVETENKNKGYTAGAHDKSSRTSHKTDVSKSDESDESDEAEVVNKFNEYDSDSSEEDSQEHDGSTVIHEDYSNEWKSGFVDVATKEDKVIKENHELFSRVLELAKSQYLITSGRFGLFKDLIRATYIVVRSFGANLLGSNGLFEKTIRHMHKVVSYFWSAVLGNSGLLTAFIHHTRWVLFQLLSSILGACGLLNYAVDRTHRVESDYTKSLYGNYNHWLWPDFYLSSKKWSEEIDKDFGILPVHPYGLPQGGNFKLGESVDLSETLAGSLGDAIGGNILSDNSDDLSLNNENESANDGASALSSRNVKEGASA